MNVVVVSIANDYAIIGCDYFGAYQPGIIFYGSYIDIGYSYVFVGHSNIHIHVHALKRR